MERIKKDANENIADKSPRTLAIRWDEIVIAYLLKGTDGKFYFKYDAKGISDARREGYDYLVGFPKINKVYDSDRLFPAIETRITRMNREDIQKKYGKESYDAFDFLAASGGRLITDALSFEEVKTENIRYIQMLHKKIKKADNSTRSKIKKYSPPKIIADRGDR